MFQKGNILWKLRKRVGAKKGNIVSEETKRKISIANKGNKWGFSKNQYIHPKTYLKYKCYFCKKEFMMKKGKRNGYKTFCNNECRFKYNKGETATNWKGGISPIYKFLIKTKNWKEWRKSVFERDGYTCNHCNIKGGYLEPHHKIPVVACLEKNEINLIFNVNNGVTLCRDCHLKETHKQKKQNKEENKKSNINLRVNQLDLGLLQTLKIKQNVNESNIIKRL